MTPFLWDLNLAAEHELAGNAVGAGTRRSVRRWRQQIVGLLGPDDAVLGDPVPHGAVGQSWCATPQSADRLTMEGVPAFVLPMEVLRNVNHRRFTLAWDDLGAWCRSIEEITERCSRGPTRLKRPFSFAGRNQRVVSGELPMAWIRASIEEYGGLLVEPELEVQEELSLHGWVDAAGVLLGRPMVVQAGFRTEWIDAPLASWGEKVGAALFDAGYLGPFGIDALVWNDSGTRVLRPVSELNARYTMVWGRGMHQQPWRERAVALL